MLGEKKKVKKSRKKARDKKTISWSCQQHQRANATRLAVVERDETPR
jgi:hypothetical protein